MQRQKIVSALSSSFSAEVRVLSAHYITWRVRGGFLEEAGRLTSDRNLALQIIPMYLYSIGEDLEYSL